MSDIVERLDDSGEDDWSIRLEAKAEIERLQVYRSFSRYWRGQCERAEAEVERLRAENARLQGIIQFMDAAKLHQGALP